MRCVLSVALAHERTPSLHVYRDAERGWYCYGCQQGGSVHDFAAQLRSCWPVNGGSCSLPARVFDSYRNNCAPRCLLVAASKFSLQPERNLVPVA